MIRGIYIAASGLNNSAQNIDVAGNNITNSDTAGFKKDAVVSGSFGEYLSYKLANGVSEEIGGISHGVEQAEIYTSFDQGALKETGQSLDLAIMGEGFFTLQSPEGATLLTRNGHFLLNEEGYLCDTSGNLLVGTGGPLKVGQTDFTVTVSGEVTANRLSCGTLLITCPQDLTALTKAGENSFIYDGQSGDAFGGYIRQGCLEGANVDMVQEMSSLMEYSRSYQACSQLIKMMDKIAEKTVNDLAGF